MYEKDALPIHNEILMNLNEAIIFVSKNGSIIKANPIAQSFYTVKQ